MLSLNTQLKSLFLDCSKDNSNDNVKINKKRKNKQTQDTNNTNDQNKKDDTSNNQKKKRRFRKRPKINIEDDDEQDNNATFFQTIFSPLFSIPVSEFSEEELKSPKAKNLQTRILKSNMDKKVKDMAIQRLKTLDSDKQKQIEWFESLLKIPFKKYSELPVKITDSQETISNYFKESIKILDNSVYGLDSVKEEFINYIAQFISCNSNTMPRIIALQGNAGVGKTVIVRKGLSKILNRPIRTISCGGLRDSAAFNGFEYTYSGSRYGIIVQSLINLGIMNPIIFMDELDKISNTTDGIDIQNILIHLTDPSQNNTFEDKFFAGIDIDLSKAIFIFSFNDISLINPILKDRLHIIKVPDPTIKDKIIIAKQYLLKDLSINIGQNPDNFIFEDLVLEYIIKEYCKEDKGVRNLKRCIETILLKINAARFLGSLCKYKCIKNINFPILITKEIAKELIGEKEKDDKWEHVLSSMYI